MSFLPAIGLFSLFVFIAIATVYRNKDKNNRIHDAKLRSQIRAETKLLSTRVAAPKTAEPHINTFPGMAIIESDDLTDTQYALVKLIFAGEDNSVKQQEDHWKNVRETRRFK